MPDPAPPVDVLVVDDDRDMASLTAQFLEREAPQFTTDTAIGAAAGMDHLTTATDCVVSDYEMPGTSGIEFLQQVRAAYPDLPFILFTGKGSEEIASHAISAGVTDYLQKGSSSDQYTVLANRIKNVVAARRSEREAERRRHRLEQLLKTVPGCIVTVDASGEFTYANRRAEDVLGLEPDRVSDRAYNDPAWSITDLQGNPIPDAELPFRKVVDSGEPVFGERHMIEWPDGTRRALSVNGAPIFDEDGTVMSTVFALTDITDRLEREREIETVDGLLTPLLDRLPVIVFRLDADGGIRRADGRSLDCIAGEPSALVGESVFELFDGVPAISDRFQRALDGQPATWSVKQDDTPIRVCCHPVRDETGTVTGAIGLLLDVSERNGAA